MAASEIKEGETLEMICRDIYLSCDPDCTDQVPTLRLIEYVKPFLEKHPFALKSLQADMDPEGTNIGIPYQLFRENMGMWVEKILDSHENNETLNKTPPNFSNLEENSDFAQSTPRQRRSSSKYFTVTDFGSSEEDLEDKNEADRSSESKSDESKIIERVTYQKNKALSENELLKNQVAAAEEQLEKLQADLDTYRMRLMNEQNLNELLKKDRMDDIKDEMNKNEQAIETYRKKLQDYERDNLYINTLNKELESENMTLLQNCETLEAEKKAMRQELEELKTVIESKDMELSEIVKQKEELEEELKVKIFLNQDLADENDFLDHQKVSLERKLSINARPMSPILNVSQREGDCIPVYSLNKRQQRFTHLWHTYPINKIKTEGEKLNFSLPTKLNESVDEPYNCYRFPIASGRDLHQSFMLSNSLTDQSMKLNGYPEVSLQAELIQAQGSISEDCRENQLLKTLEEELILLKKERQDLEEEYDAYKKKVAEQNSSNIDVAEEVKKFKRLCNSYKKTIRNISQSNKELKQTVQLKTKKIVLLESKMKIRKRFLNITKNNLKKRMMLNKELNEHNEQLIRKLEMKSQHIIELSQKLLITNQEHNNIISTQKAQIEEALNNIAKQEILIEEQNIKIKQLTDREKSHEIADNNYKTKISNQLEQLAVKTKELDAIKKSYEEKITSLAEQLTQTTQELKILKQNKLEEETTNHSIILAKAKEEFDILKLSYEKKIANQARQLTETANELAEAKKKFDALEQNFEMVKMSQEKGCNLHENNHYRWITQAMMIMIFALVFLYYWHYQGNDFDFNFIRKIDMGSPPI